jgi:RNA 2',3'-cyclic 3'-phosphodiesterase
MRLFTALDLSDAQRSEAARAAEALQRELDRVRAPRAVRWVAPDRLHLTVRFIGEVGDDFGARIAEALSAPLEVAPFTLALGDPGTFPSSGQPRVVWLGLAEGAAGSSAAHDAIDARLAALGVPSEERSFKAHLTLGRVREIGRAQAGALMTAARALHISRSPATVAHLTLYRSYLSPKGPRYEPLARIPLTK